MQYPKILIVGQYFDKKSGAGITMTNLFKGWDSSSLAAIADNVQNPDFTVCDKLYHLGEKEIERGFPFNFKGVSKNTPSGEIFQSLPTTHSDITVKKPDLAYVPTFKDKILFATGQIHRRRKFKLSNQLQEWINNFKPDILYSQLSSLELIDFILLLKQQYNLPLVIHMMDDWPSTITRDQLPFFKSYWSWKINHRLNSVFGISSLLLGISDAMNEEYKKRYNKTFIPFHNPIDTLAWSAQSKSDYSVKNAFILLYAGRIGTGITTCLLEVAEAIKGLNKKGLKFVFRIQTHANHPVLNQLKQYPFVEIAMPSAYESLPAIFASADALLLANDFDAAGISFLKYSMPTKASEYMASGTPILVYSPEATAVAKHAKNHKWALVVDNKNSNILKGSISRLYSEIDLRSELGSTAKQFANEQYNSSFVRANFRKEFVKILSEN